MKTEVRHQSKHQRRSRRAPLFGGLRLLLLLLFASCSTSQYQTSVVDIDPDGWYSSAEFTLPVVDTISIVDLRLLMRYDNRLLHDSVELYISTTAPDGVMWREEYTLYPTSRKEFQRLCESDYRRNVRWRQMGDYRLSIQPKRVYRGVSAVGVEIQPHQ